ncbi:MAG: ThuA domain-containing protein, partial [Planctomycetes bacterium]|nr:ThuA domain-containing protein [Planctomycetota bacterium]
MKQAFASKRNNSDNTGVSGLMRVCMILALLLAGCASRLGTRSGKKVLVYTKNGEGFVHKNIPASIECIQSICRQNGWICQASDDPAIFTTEKIAAFDVLVFSNTNNET